MSIEELENLDRFMVNLLDPESIILDCNKGEKLIIEMNNHICLGEYELARTFFKQIIEVIPVYMKYFYNLIFLRGVPDKWLLSNQMRTSANYIWILYQDYKNELINFTNCPKIKFSDQFLKCNEFDLIITTAFYNSYENLENFEMNIDFLKDLRHTYNFFACISTRSTFFLPKLRILSPDRNKKGLYLCIDEYLYETSENSLFDFTKQKSFMENLKNFILTQPILSKHVIDKILSNCTSDLNKREDVTKIQEIFQIIYVDLIMLFIHFKDYQKVYEYLKFIPFNVKINFCKSYVNLLFSVIVVLTHSEIENPQDVLIFTGFCANRLKIDSKNHEIINFKKLPYFTNQISEYTRIKNICPIKDHEKWLLKHKIYESLLANSNEELLSNLHTIEDLFIVYQTENSEKIPIFFLNYTKNLEKNKNTFDNLCYEELMSLILSYSKFKDVNYNSNEFLWKKAITNNFWNEYLNFLRVYEEHCLGYVLRQSVKYVQQRQFDKAVMLLHPLNNLKLLLILFVWDKFENDITSRKEILKVFWNSYLKYREPDSKSYTLVPYFEDIIVNLDYVINFSMWIQEKLNKDDSNVLYDDLLAHSIPFVMKNYIIDFDFNELLNYFIQRFPMSNKKLQKNHFHSSMIIFSFFFYHLILKKIEDHFSNAPDNYDAPLFTEREKEEMLKILQKIILFPYRLNIMGDIFNLIFIKIKYFTDNREKDNIMIENNQHQHPHSSSQFLYHKKIFIEVVKFLKLIMEPLENFNYDNLTQIFEQPYLDKEIYDMIKSVTSKNIFLEDLKFIDTDYLTALKGNKDLSYKNFLVIKSDSLKFNVDELIFRFNIVDNPWLEIIYENNENNSFLSTILQNSQHYFQIAKKFQMWEIAEVIIDFFKLPDSFRNQIHLMNYFTNLKSKLTNLEEETNFSVDVLINFNFLNKLITKEYKSKNKIYEDEFQLSDEDLNFEYFKIFFDLSLTENISTHKSTILMDKAISYLENSREKDNNIFYIIIDRYKVFIDPNLPKDQKEECLSKMVVSTKNLGAVDITSLKYHLKILSNQRQALQNLIEKVNQPNAIELSHEELNKYFLEAFQTLIDSEEYYYKNMETEQINDKSQNQTNYLKIFLNYLINIGDIYYKSRLKYKQNGTNYLRLLKKYPKEIIAKLFLKYNSESEALKVAKMTKTDLISVILEFTEYYKKSIIHYTEFNNYFSEIMSSMENNFDNKIINFEALCEKEEWVKGSPKTFPLLMRILEFVYKLSYDKSESYEEYIQFVPLFVSLYRIEFDLLSDEEQVKFWTLIIDKYMNVKIFNNYIKMIFNKFYFYRTFYQKNYAFKSLFEKIHYSNTNNDTNSNENLKEKYEMYKRMYEKVKTKTELSDMLPKTFSYIPTTNEYIQKLTDKMSNYLGSKLEKKKNDYSKYFSNINQNSNEMNVSNNLNIKFTDIQNLSYKKNINFYENLCRGLLAQKQYDLALEIADNYLDDTKSDVIQILINEIVINTDDEEKLFKLLIRMKDKNKIFEYTKKYWYQWKPETTITILRLIKDEFECGIKQDEINNMIKKLKVFSSIFKRDILPYKTLKKLEEDCLKNIEKILDELMLENSHDLCYKLLRVYNKFDLYKNTVKFSEIKLLLSTNDIQNKISALDKLSEVNENKINFCTQLIKELNNYQNKLLIINYLLQNYHEELNEELKVSLINHKISIKVFFLIPKELQEKLIHLINYPELIIETLLINLRFDIIKNIFHYFPELQSDTSITFYAEKAMFFGKINKTKEKSQIDLNQVGNDLVILTTENYRVIKMNHHFNAAPDFELFVKFMNLCKDINIISKVCFEVSNNCSKYLLEKSPTQPKLLFINFISKVLNYLEKRLISYENLDGDYQYDNMIKIKEKLNTYEKLIELFKEFIYQEIDDLIDLELNKFYEEDQYKEMVRDKLIDNDYLNLAVKYCKELNIDSKRVDFKLGLFSLKNRNFGAARKGFEKILISNNSRRGNFSSFINKNLPNEEHDEVVNQIIKILQGSFNLKIDELEKIHRYLIFRLSCSIIPNEESTLKILDRYRELSLRRLSNSVNTDSDNLIANSNPIKLTKYIDVILLDEYLKNEKNVIVNETLYYVKTYGTTTQLINFYIDNDLLDDTVNYVINNRISLEVFKEEVVKKCYEKRKMMNSLCLSLKKVYMTNKYAKELIEEVINFLKTEKAHEELIEVYMLMNDYLKASLEAINIIKKTTDVDVKMQFYQKAALNLDEYLNSNTQTIIFIGDTNEDILNKRGTKKVERSTLQALLKLLKLQIEVLNIKKDIQYTLITDEEEERYKIIKEIITIDDSLSLAIMKEYNLKISDVFMRCTIEFISCKSFTEFESLLHIIKKWNNLGIIIQFSENFNELWDNILLQAISLISLEDENSILYAKENIIPRFHNDESRMYSLYLIGEFENSLILAYQLKNTELIKEIKLKAEFTNNKELIDLINNLN